LKNWKERKKIKKVTFFSLFDLRKVKKKKIEGKKYKKNLCYYEEKIFLLNMRGK